MKNKYFTTTLLLILLYFLSTAFQQDDIKQLMDERIAKKVKEYRAAQIKECYQNALEKATKIVDSTLIANAIYMRADTTTRPPKPSKPTKPEIKEASDTTPIKPFYEN